MITEVLITAISPIISSPSTKSFTDRPQGGRSTLQTFSKLPVEIQDQIWLFALPDPRVVEIRKRGRTMVHGLAQHECACSIADPIPLLYTCRDSRRIALKTYTLAFSSLLENPTYFDNARDTVLMGDLNALDYVLSKRRGGSPSGDSFSVRYLAIDPTSPLNTNPGVPVTSTSNKAVHDIPNRGVSLLSEAITGYGSSLSELLVLYPVEDEGDEVPAWFESGVVDLLEESVSSGGDFDLRDMPQITCLPYQADEGRAGRWEAVADWMVGEPFVGDLLLGD